jgi:hypothetical protein
MTRADDVVVDILDVWQECADVEFLFPYQLKQLIDLSCQRNMLFTFDGKRYGPSLDHGRDSQAIQIEGGVGSSASCSR